MAEENTRITADDEIRKIDNLLKQYEEKNNIHTIKHDPETNRILDLTLDELKKITEIECGIYAYVLSKHAYNIQKLVNEEQARYNWADNRLKQIYGKYGQSCRGYTFEERLLSLVSNNDYARRLHELMGFAQNRIDRLNFLSTKVSFISKTLDSLKDSKRRG